MARRIGFCCTFVSPSGDADEQRLMNMRQPTIASPWLFAARLIEWQEG